MHVIIEDQTQKEKPEIIMELDANLFTPEQVAEILQLHASTVCSYVRQGKLDAICLGRNYRVTSNNLELFIDSNRTSGIRNQKQMI